MDYHYYYLLFKIPRYRYHQIILFSLKQTHRIFRFAYVSLTCTNVHIQNPRKPFSSRREQLDSNCSNRYFFTSYHITWQPQSTFLSVSLFPLSSISLSCFLSSSLPAPLSCCSSLLNPRSFFFSLWISLSKQSHSSQNRWVWNVPTLHPRMDDSSPRWDCVFSCLYMGVFSHLFPPLFCNSFCLLFMWAPMQTQSHGLHSASLSLFSLCSGTSSHLPLN